MKSKLYVVPNEIKLRLIKNRDLNNIKYITREEVKKRFYFDYDYRAIKYIMSNYNLKYDNAKTYIDNMYYIDNIKEDNEIFNNIKEMKKRLIENELLIFDDNFKYYLSNCIVYFYGYDVIDRFYGNLIDEIKNLTDVEIIKQDSSNLNKILDVYEFDTIENEIVFVAENIIELLNNNININNIYITNYSSEYENILSMIFNMYNIPINLNSKDSIINTNFGAYFIDLIKNVEYTCDEIIKKIDEYVNIHNISLEYYNKIISVCNNYFKNEQLNNIDIECIISELKNISVDYNKLNNAVNIIDYNNYIFDDDMYVFFIGFNQGVVPKTYKNEELISDNIKAKYNLSTSVELNILTKSAFINKLYSIKNIIISYKLSSEFDTFYKSNLVDELNMNINKYEYKYIYSNTYNRLLLGKSLDELIKYGLHNKYLDKLYSSYPSYNYLTYDNKFKGINSNNLYKYINNRLIVSYTHLNNYNRCAFRYYLSNILKLNSIDDTFSIKIGNLYHYVLSKAFLDGFDFDECFNNYIKDVELSIKEKFFVGLLKKELFDTIEIIKYQNTFSSINDEMYEERVEINKNINNVWVTFRGVIDKIKYKIDEDNIYIAIIDYKTGNVKINLDYCKYGIDMQLPIYLLLAKNINKFNNKHISYIGFYLQKICNKLDGDKTNKISNLKLQGYTNEDEDLINLLDNNYSSSEVIRGLKLSSKGFYKSSKVLSNEKINELLDLVNKVINKNINDILIGKYDINPKKINNENKGCEYCTYKDICYKKEDDIINLDNIEYERV